MSGLIDPADHLEMGLPPGYWRVPEKGYEWRRSFEDALPDTAQLKVGQDKTGIYLLPRVGIGVESQGAQTVYPMFSKGNRLLRGFDELAETVSEQAALLEGEPRGTDPAQDLIKGFVDEWGWLGLGEQITIGDHEPSDLREGESMAVWKKELAQWHDLRTTWRAIMTLDASDSAGPHGDKEVIAPDVIKARKLLESRVKWQWNNSTPGARPVGVAYQGVGAQSGWELIAAEFDNTTKRWFQRFNPLNEPEPDVVEPARYYVAREVNKVVAKHVPFQWIYLERKSKLFPQTLLGGLYYLFLSKLGAAERKGFASIERWCANERCLLGKTFVARRRDQRYCSQRCQKNAHQRKQRVKERDAQTAKSGPEEEMGEPSFAGYDARLAELERGMFEGFVEEHKKAQGTDDELHCALEPWELDNERHED